VPFAAAFLIEALGWRGAFLAQGAASLAVMVPLALLMKEPPRPVQVIAARADAPLTLPPAR
jgi:predicted MFS family arabinose efflux permease